MPHTPRRSLQRVLPQVPLDPCAEQPEGPQLRLPGVPAAPPPRPVVACVREQGRVRVRVISGGLQDALVAFPKDSDKDLRQEGRRFTVERLTWIEPQGKRGYYRAAGEIRRIEEVCDGQTAAGA